MGVPCPSVFPLVRLASCLMYSMLTSAVQFRCDITHRSLSRGFIYNTANLFCSLGFFGMGTGLKFVAYLSDKPCMYAIDHAILLTASCGMSIVAMNVARMTHQHGYGYDSMGRYVSISPPNPLVLKNIFL